MLKKYTFQTLFRIGFDISCQGMAQSLELMRLLDFSSILFQDKLVLMLLWPKEESRLTAVIRPFNFTVSIVLL